jgi:hypothetical protein
MIFTFFLNLVVAIFSIIFEGLPKVTSLPTINGFDIDTTLLNGVGDLNAIFGTFWYLKDFFYGAIVLFVYYGTKMLLKAVLGSRTPGLH